MGTRAIVKWNGKIIAYTHWDGNPQSLGEDLVRLFDSIKESYYDYGKKQFKLKKDFILGVCLTHQIDGTKTSNDSQEWEYDIRDDGVWCKCLYGDEYIFVKLGEPKIESYYFSIYDIDLFVKSNGNIKKFLDEEEDEK